MPDLKILNIGNPNHDNHTSESDTIGGMNVHGPLQAHSFKLFNGKDLADDTHLKYEWEVNDDDGNITSHISENAEGEELNAQSLFNTLFEEISKLQYKILKLEERVTGVEGINEQQQQNIDELKEKDDEHDERITNLENIVGATGEELPDLSQLNDLLEYFHIEEDATDTTYNEHLRIARDNADGIIFNGNGMSMGSQQCINPISSDDMLISQLMKIDDKAALAMGNYGFTIGTDGDVQFGKYTAVTNNEAVED